MKRIGILLALLILTNACVPNPTQSPLQSTATALQSSFASQYLVATQQSLMATLQASGGQPPFVVVTAVGIPVTAPSQATLQALTAQPCNFLWTTQDLPEVTSAAQNAFARVPTLADVTVRAQAYGENCLEPDGSVRYFNATTTDFYLTTEIDSLGNLNLVAQIVMAALDALDAPMSVTLPSKMGYLELTLIANETRGTLRSTFDQITFSRTQMLTGGAFVDAIGGVVEQ
jgi:hypothetical protein